MPNNELTEVEINKIKEEINHRQTVLTPKFIAEVQRTRAFGDLSENDEYRSAKRELNRNYSRIRYLKAILENSVVVNYESDEDTVGLFDHVCYPLERRGRRRAHHNDSHSPQARHSERPHFKGRSPCSGYPRSQGRREGSRQG